MLHLAWSLVGTQIATEPMIGKNNSYQRNMDIFFIEAGSNHTTIVTAAHDTVSLAFEPAVRERRSADGATTNHRLTCMDEKSHRLNWTIFGEICLTRTLRYSSCRGGAMWPIILNSMLWIRIRGGLSILQRYKLWTGLPLFWEIWSHVSTCGDHRKFSSEPFTIQGI